MKTATTLVTYSSIHITWEQYAVVKGMLTHCTQACDEDGMTVMAPTHVLEQISDAVDAIV